MKHLLLIRHAKSDWSIKEFSDFARALNKRGLDEAKAMEKDLEEIIPSIEKFYCSPAVRTIQTLDILLGEEISNSKKVEFCPELYLASSNEIDRIVYKQLLEFNSIAIVGHNEGISIYLNNIIEKGLDLEFPTGSWVLLQKKSNVLGSIKESNWIILKKSW